MIEATYEGLAAIFRAGAYRSRGWVLNHDAQRQADVLEAMADEAERLARSAEGPS